MNDKSDFNLTKADEIKIDDNILYLVLGMLIGFGLPGFTILLIYLARIFYR